MVGAMLVLIAASAALWWGIGCKPGLQRPGYVPALIPITPAGRRRMVRPINNVYRPPDA